MRNAFVHKLEDLAEENDKLVLLVGDIGNRMFDTFKEKYPGRFYNCGIAEANMVTMAAGMASCGLLPVCYTIAPFITYRCMEQIRLDMCYHNHPVILVGTGAGLSYASLGTTHHTLEDVGMLRTLQNMRILCPGDVHELNYLLDQAIKIPAPTYLRIGKKGERVVCNEDVILDITKPNIISKGPDVLLLNMGNTLPLAEEISLELGKANTQCQLVSVHTMKPFPEEEIAKMLQSHRLCVTLEEHVAEGGLGCAISQILTEKNITNIFLLRHGLQNPFAHKTYNSQEEARELMGLSKDEIVKNIKSRLSPNS